MLPLFPVQELVSTGQSFLAEFPRPSGYVLPVCVSHFRSIPLQRYPQKLCFSGLSLPRFRNVMHCKCTTPDEAKIHRKRPQETLLANSSCCLVEPLKSRNAGRSERVAIKPIDKANQIDGRCDGQVLQMRFRPPHIARTAQVEGPYPLRNGGLNSRSQSISLLEGFRPLKLACSLERGMLRDASLMTSDRRG